MTSCWLDYSQLRGLCLWPSGLLRGKHRTNRDRVTTGRQVAGEDKSGPHHLCLSTPAQLTTTMDLSRCLVWLERHRELSMRGEGFVLSVGQNEIASGALLMFYFLESWSFFLGSSCFSINWISIFKAGYHIVQFSGSIQHISFPSLSFNCGNL